MKRILWAAACTCLAAFIADAAESIKFTETYSEKLVKDSWGDYEVLPSVAATLSANVPVPGLGSTVFGDDTSLSFEIGSYSFETTIGDADKQSANSSTFYLNSETGKKVGQITFSRRGDNLSIAATAKPLDGSVVATDYVDEDTSPGTFSGDVGLWISAGGLDLDRTLYYKATKSLSTKSAGGVPYTLTSLKISGSLDTTKPTASFVGLKSRVSTDVITVKVKATDNIGVEYVGIVVNEDVDNLVLIEEPTGLYWQADIALETGLNVLRAVSIDFAGNVSKVATAKVTRTF